MEQNQLIFSSIVLALHRARLPILTVALTYILSVMIGIIMVHLGSGFALQTRDNLINTAIQSDSAAISFHQGNRLQAAVFDFGENLFLGAVPKTFAGLGIVIPYPIIFYQGWIGGIVSVDNQHHSRLSQLATAVYYLITLIVQLIPYSLAGGAGIQMGITFYRQYSDKSVPKWLGIPKSALLDVARLYALVIPLFFIASLWEFLAA